MKNGRGYRCHGIRLRIRGKLRRESALCTLKRAPSHVARPTTATDRLLFAPSSHDGGRLSPENNVKSGPAILLERGENA